MHQKYSQNMVTGKKVASCFNKPLAGNRKKKSSLQFKEYWQSKQIMALTSTDEIFNCMDAMGR